MDNKEIFKKAMQKAIKNGYKPDDIQFEGDKNFDIYWPLMDETKGWMLHIFSHDFTKALWGEKIITWSAQGIECDQIAWRYHLQQMVLVDDPIKYLEKYV